jgi:hypothetical protein
MARGGVTDPATVISTFERFELRKQTLLITIDVVF